MKYNEIWEDIFNDGKYFISNLGNIKNSKGITLKQHKDKDGYMIINLCGTTYKVHRIVAGKFLDNSKCYTEVNHKNEIKNDNRVENLEWCSRKYNINYGTTIKRIKETQLNNPTSSKRVFQYTKENEKINEFPSINEASRITEICNVNISQCCNGKRKTAGGYIWKMK